MRDAMPWPRRPWDLVIAGIAAVALVVGGVFAAVTLIPPAVAQLGAAASDGVTAVPLGHGSVVVPAGWVTVPRGADAVEVRSPDGVLVVEVTSTEEDAAAALGAAIAAASADSADTGDVALGPHRTETLASGEPLTHVDVGDAALAAAVGAASAVSVVARVSDGALERYRPALAQLLEGIRP